MLLLLSGKIPHSLQVSPSFSVCQAVLNPPAEGLLSPLYSMVYTVTMGESGPLSASVFLASKIALITFALLLSCGYHSDQSISRGETKCYTKAASNLFWNEAECK